MLNFRDPYGYYFPYYVINMCVCVCACVYLPVSYSEINQLFFHTDDVVKGNSYLSTYKINLSKTFELMAYVKYWKNYTDKNIYVSVIV